METITKGECKNGDELWERTFFNAKRFFESKGNINTRSKLKDKWFNEFKHDLTIIFCKYKKM